MYVLRNKIGNAYRHTVSKAKRDRLVAAGWLDVTPEQNAPPAENDGEDEERGGVEDVAPYDSETEQNEPLKKRKAAKKADKE